MKPEKTEVSPPSTPPGSRTFHTFQPPSRFSNSIGLQLHNSKSLQPQIFNAATPMRSKSTKTFSVPRAQRTTPPGNRKVTSKPTKPINSPTSLVRRLFGFTTSRQTRDSVPSFPGPRSASRRNFFQSRKVLSLYLLNYHLHTGYDSEIYAGERKEDTERVSIKICEKTQALEALRYTVLLDDDAPVGVPKLLSYGWSEESSKTYLITEFLGYSLRKILTRLDGRRMRVKDVCMLSVRLIDCLIYFHNKGVIHGNITPGHVLTGRKKTSGKVYLIDYMGMQPWRYQGKRVPCEARSVIARDPHYAAPRSCGSRVLSRRDDLISLSYTIIKLLTGKLPWENDGNFFWAPKLDRMKGLVGKGLLACDSLPTEIVDFVKIVHSMKYSESPDYERLSELFQSCLRRVGEKDDNSFEWFENPSFIS